MNKKIANIYKNAGLALREKINTPKGQQIVLDEAIARTKKCIINQADFKHAERCMFLYLYYQLTEKIEDMLRKNKLKTSRNIQDDDLEYISTVKRRLAVKKRELQRVYPGDDLEYISNIKKRTAINKINLQRVSLIKMSDIEYLEFF